MISSQLPFDKDITLHDVAVNPNQEDEIFVKNKSLLPYFRIGLSFISTKNSSNVMTICRKGLVKMFPFQDKLLEINNVDEDSKTILQVLLKPCAQSLNNGTLLLTLRKLFRNL
jgi:hypothetical protein